MCSIYYNKKIQQGLGAIKNKKIRKSSVGEFGDNDSCIFQLKFA